MSFSKILIANRGEIAVRVARTARALGYRTVAVASEADLGSPHLEAADEAVIVGAAPAAESYLNVARLLAAAERTGADALHPGYGFLAEDADFARAVVETGRTFIGPDPEAIRRMGDKALAKRCAAAAGVPCLAGHDGADQSFEALSSAAEGLGYPLLVKAAAGGGGRGLRKVEEPAQLAAALASARSEAASAFGRGDLLLEPFLEGARHVEVQVFGDRQGGVVHLGERECSIQRRFQKLIEESPSPGVSAALGAALGEAAVRLARSIGYVGAGTVEFLLRPDGSFFFLEMNPRLQVEHPVTELVTGLDLVEWQLRVAAGEPLPLAQEQIVRRGHAIEARVCAEDPAAGFAPQTGKIRVFHPPVGAGIRVDHGLATGVEIGGHYDSLLAKVCAWGRDRAEARRRLEGALEEMLLLGPTTNRHFLRQVLAHPAFVAGETTTGFLDRHFPPAERAAVPAPATLALAAALFSDAERSRHGELWGFCNTGSRGWPLELGWDGGRAELRIESTGGASYRVRIGESQVEVEIRRCEGGAVRCSIDGCEESAAAWLETGELRLDHGGAEQVFHEGRKIQSGIGRDGDPARLLAPMSARVIAVEARVGESVEAGQCLVVLEAMKLESRVVAARAGRVEEVCIAVGEQVRHRQLLVRLAASP